MLPCAEAVWNDLESHGTLTTLLLPPDDACDGSDGGEHCGCFGDDMVNT